jgi:hypothetical protein
MLDTGPDDYGYIRRLSEIWGKEAFIMIEHDVVPTVGQLMELALCKEKNCTYACPLASDPKLHDIYMQQYGTTKLWNIWDSVPQGRCYSQNEFPEYAKGIMCAKVSLEYQQNYKLQPVRFTEVYTQFPKSHVHYGPDRKGMVHDHLSD